MGKLGRAALFLLLSSAATMPYAEAGDLHKVAAASSQTQGAPSSTDGKCFSEGSLMAGYLKNNNLQSVASVQRENGGELVYIQRTGVPFNEAAYGEVWVVQRSGRVCPIGSFPQLVVFDGKVRSNPIFDGYPALSQAFLNSTRFTALAAKDGDRRLLAVFFEGFKKTNASVWREESQLPGTMTQIDAGSGDSSFRIISDHTLQ